MSTSIPPIIHTANPVPPKFSEIPPRIPAAPIAAAPKRHATSAASEWRWLRIAKIFGIAVVTGGALLMLVIVMQSSPQRSINALMAAIERRDRDGVAAHVDAKSLAESWRRLVVERYQLQRGQVEQDDIFGGFLAGLGESIVARLAADTYTPEKVVAMMCGESAVPQVEKQMTTVTDTTVDVLTNDGSAKAQLAGSFGKLLVRGFVRGALVAGESKAKTEAAAQAAKGYEVTAQYESANRYLIIQTPKDSDAPGVGFVYKRMGLFDWKLSEVRLFPQSKHGLAAAQ